MWLGEWNSAYCSTRSVLEQQKTDGLSVFGVMVPLSGMNGAMSPSPGQSQRPDKPLPHDVLNSIVAGPLFEPATSRCEHSHTWAMSDLYRLGALLKRSYGGELSRHRNPARRVDKMIAGRPFSNWRKC